MRINGRSVRGYKAEWFRDTWERYPLPDKVDYDE